MKTKTMNFGEAIELLKQGKKVTREFWILGFVWLKPQTILKSKQCKDPILKMIVDRSDRPVYAAPELCFTTGTFVQSNWYPEVEDMLADDWYEVE